VTRETNRGSQVEDLGGDGQSWAGIFPFADF